MDAVRDRDLRRTLDVAAELAAVDTWPDLRDRALPAVADLLDGHSVVHHDMDFRGQTEISVYWPVGGFGLHQFEGYAEHLMQHPLVASLDRARPGGLRLSEVVSVSSWQRSGAYREVFGGLGIVDQVACVIGSRRGEVQAVSVLRDGPFGVREQTLLGLLQRHLGRAGSRAVRGGLQIQGLQTAPRAQWTHVGGETRPVAVAGLTARELQVLDIVAGGCTSSATARRLGISRRTVEKHVQNIHTKLGVSSSIEAVRTAGAGLATDQTVDDQGV